MTEKKKLVYSMCMMMVSVSFFGFILENIWLFFIRGVIDNRNMTVPFLLGYGVGIAVLYVLVGTPRCFMPLIKGGKEGEKIPIRIRYLLYFLISAAAVTLAELCVGFAVEYTMGFRYWDYSAIPFNITKYTSLPTSIGFGLIITLFMSLVFERGIIFFSRMPYRLLRILSIAFCIITVFDFVISFHAMYIRNGLNILWQIRFPWA